MSISTPSVEQAQRTLQDVSVSEIMVGAVLTPRSGQMPARMKNVREISQFLEDIASKEFSVVSRKNIHHLSYERLVAWIRDTINDPELATEVEALTTDGRQFGQLSGEVKALLAKRVEQCEQVLGISTTKAVLS